MRKGSRGLARIPRLDIAGSSGNHSIIVRKPAASKQWEDTLGRVQVQSTDPNLLQTFYTALYHASLAPVIISDVDGQYRGPDGKVHQAQAFNYYSTLSLWDTFRTEHPLITLVQPGRVNDIISTMLLHFKYSGNNTLPVWTESGKENWSMIGNHSIPVIADAYFKGFRKWDANEALADMVASTEQRRG